MCVGDVHMGSRTSSVCPHLFLFLVCLCTHESNCVYVQLCLQVHPPAHVCCTSNMRLWVHTSVCIRVSVCELFACFLNFISDPATTFLVTVVLDIHASIPLEMCVVHCSLCSSFTAVTLQMAVITASLQDTVLPWSLIQTPWSLIQTPWLSKHFPSTLA